MSKGNEEGYFTQPPNTMPRIEEIWAYTQVDPRDNNEGVIALETKHGPLPMIAADKERLDDLRPYAMEMAVRTGRPVNVTKFSVREDVEVISSETTIKDVSDIAET